jgi:hypothetical protein
MHREAFSLNGGQCSGIYLLQGPMRSTQRLLRLTLRLVFRLFCCISLFSLGLFVSMSAREKRKVVITLRH